MALPSNLLPPGLATFHPNSYIGRIVQTLLNGYDDVYDGSRYYTRAAVFNCAWHLAWYYAWHRAWSLSHAVWSRHSAYAEAKYRFALEVQIFHHHLLGTFLDLDSALQVADQLVQFSLEKKLKWSPG